MFSESSTDDSTLSLTVGAGGVDVTSTQSITMSGSGLVSAETNEHLTLTDGAERTATVLSLNSYEYEFTASETEEPSGTWTETHKTVNVYPVDTDETITEPLTFPDSSTSTDPQQAIRDEYLARATNIARWQAELADTTDPAQQDVLKKLIDSEQAILATLAADAAAAGITADALAELDN
ncbi:MAG: hypothetical protein R3C49_15075 [Planctomycetaceae bacterium]